MDREKAKTNYRDIADELAAATTIAYTPREETGEKTRRILPRLVYLDCFLFERIVNQFLRDESKAGKLINAYTLSLVQRPEVNLSVEEFQRNYDVMWNRLAAGWKAEMDPAFKPSLGVKMPLAAMFLAECGETSLEVVTYVAIHILETRKHLPQILKPLLSEDKLLFD